MAKAFHPAFGQTVEYEIVALPEHPDGQVRETIRRVIRYIREDSQTPMVQQDARRALELGKGDPILGVWTLVKDALKFQHDQETAQQLQVEDSRKQDIIEVLIRPRDQSLLIALRGHGIEDCDGYHMYGACLLLALGLKTALVTVSADKEEPNRFSHVYLAVYPPEGGRIPLDLSHGKHIGWECPNTGRLTEWPIDRSAQDVILTFAPAIVAAAVAFALARAGRKAA